MIKITKQPEPAWERNMTHDQTGLAFAYEQLYSAAARMLWSQETPDWRWTEQDSEFGWPPERCAAWQALEDCLLAGETEEPRVGEPSDPARHLITRRAPGGEDRPLGFQEAHEDWTTRLNADPGYLVDEQLQPGACVMTTPGRHLRTVSALRELAYRLAPGRPPVTIGPEAARLSTLAHEAANALRAPLGTSASPPWAPGTEPWVIPASHTVSDVPDLPMRLEDLRAAAWRAAEAVPTPEELKASGDFSVMLEASIAASDVLALLQGRPAPIWREHVDGIDPAHDLVWGSSTDSGQRQPKSMEIRAEDWAQSFASGPAPWTPTEYRYPPERHLGAQEVVLSATRAVVFAELLDELAARLRPGLHTGRIHYSVYDLCYFIDKRFRRELGAHIGL
ncbi:hypothetical protein GCM10010260_67540 [Streptomyces filipinensis]|uniref:Uncharacterized protein n=1 Tax=Streptomyces filipinensis TaxID=66887 RepID=A0A918IH95_9ACTN|nr:hypothetical protein [Streptomyces filipinensis]GGV18258.1 hypothetical protein GCM10010260_67540 [Streptomyces filipinensis]